MSEIEDPQRETHIWEDENGWNYKVTRAWTSAAATRLASEEEAQTLAGESLTDV